MELLTGEDYISGEETSRIAAGVGIFAGLLPGGKLGVKLISKTLGNKASAAATTVIGRTKDLGNLPKGERSLLDRLTPRSRKPEGELGTELRCPAPRDASGFADSGRFPRRYRRYIPQCGKSVAQGSRLDIQSTDELLDASGVVIMATSDDVGRERTRLNFANAVSEKFAFLKDSGFSEVESLPTLVRYRNRGSDVEVSIYHGRQSFEIGFELFRHGARYSISELIRVADVEAAERYRNCSATTPGGVATCLTQLEELVRKYCERALSADLSFFATLEEQRKSWADEYALDVLTEQLRPKAEAAFRQGNYRQAADLYERIRPRLSAAELKKLALAKERAEP